MEKQKAKSAKVLWIVLFTSALISVGLHAYLTSRHYTFHFGGEAGKSLCNISNKFNCDAVSASTYSEVIGIPVALLGASANALLVLLSLLAFFNPTKAALRNVFLWSTLIALSSLIMGSISILLMSSYCIFCYSLYILSFLEVFAAYSLYKEESDERTEKVVLEAQSKIKPFVPLIGAFISTAFIAMVINQNSVRSYRAEDLAPTVQGWISSWQTRPSAEIKSPRSLKMGASDENAKIKIVEFADFLCPHCRHAAPVLHSFALSQADVQLEFVPWPLDGECNSSIPQANGVRCALAQAVFCADDQHKGWEAHDWIFEHQELIGSRESMLAELRKMSDELKIDSSILEKCINTDESKSLIRSVAKVGSDLNLGGTPSIFANGKLLEGGQILATLQAARQAALQK